MAGSPLLESLFAVSDRQGLFQGDIHIVQRVGLQALMNKEINDQTELEMYRAKVNALASNSATSPELIKSLFKVEEEKTEEELMEEEIEWVTPQSTEELGTMLKNWDLDLGVVSSEEEPEDNPPDWPHSNQGTYNRDE